MRRTNLLAILAVSVMLAVGCSSPVLPSTSTAIPPTSQPSPPTAHTRVPTSLPLGITPSPEVTPTPGQVRAVIMLNNVEQLAPLGSPLDVGEPLIGLVPSRVGDRLYAVSEAGRMVSIDPADMSFQIGLNAPSLVRALAVSPAGTLAVGTLEGQVLIVADDGSVAQAIRLSDAGVPVNVLDYSPEGTRLAAALNNGVVMILDSEGEATIPTLATGSSVQALTFSPDGAILMTAGDDGFVRYWGVASGESLYTGDIGHSAAVRSLAQTSDGIILASGGADAAVKIYDGYSAEWLNTLLGHSGPVEVMSFSPDGSLLASGDSTGQLIIWDVIFGEPLLIMEAVHAGGISGLVFTGDGTQLITAGADGIVQAWVVPAE